MGKVLIVEDSEDLILSLGNLVRKERFSVFEASTGAEALSLITGNVIDLVFLDIGLPDKNGLELIPEIKRASPDTEIVMLTGMDDAKTAVTALKLGAVDYIVKPFDTIEFRNILHMIMNNRLSVKRSIVEPASGSLDSIMGRSQVMVRLKEEIKMAGQVKTPVLIEGETGTGKELVARAIHSLSAGEGGIFVKVDCGTLSANLIEAELFGYEKGAFTDAKGEKRGLVEMADSGTLFLDEIGNLPPGLQPKLLRLIDETTFRRVGGLRDISVDLRIITATNLTLQDEVGRGNFRDDLYYRLRVLSLRLPPLRDRGRDLLTLADYYLRRFSAELNKKAIRGFTQSAQTALLTYRWPGNIRELKNCIERAIIYCKGNWITPAELNIGAHGEGDAPAGELISLEAMEKRYIRKVLASVRNNKTRAAQILGISRTTLREKLGSE